MLSLFPLMTKNNSFISFHSFTFVKIYYDSKIVKVVMLTCVQILKGPTILIHDSELQMTSEPPIMKPSLANPGNIKVKDLLRKFHELPFLFLLIAMKRERNTGVFLLFSTLVCVQTFVFSGVF